MPTGVGVRAHWSGQKGGASRSPYRVWPGDVGHMAPADLSWTVVLREVRSVRVFEEAGGCVRVLG